MQKKVKVPLLKINNIINNYYKYNSTYMSYQLNRYFYYLIQLAIDEIIFCFNYNRSTIYNIIVIDQ